MGFEKDVYYYSEAKKRLNNHKAQLNIRDLIEPELEKVQMSIYDFPR